MRTVVIAKATVVATAIFGALLLSGCNKEEESESTADKNEPVPSAKPVVDAKLSNAMQSAAKAAEASPGQPSGPTNGPPQNGVMTLTQADAELARNNPSVLTFGAQGSPPLLKLGPGRLAAGARAGGTLEVSLRMGPRSAMPTLVFELEASSKDGEGPGRAVTTFKVKKASLSAQQPGQLPDGLAAEVVKVQGSSFSAVASANGANTGVTPQVAKGGEDFEPILSAGSELLQSVVLPYPDEPVGVGGFWMVKSRELFHGSDVVAYRMIKVTEINGQQAKLSLETRRYAVGQSLALSGLPPHSLLQFEGSGQGQLSISAGAALPDQAQLNDTLNAMIAQNGDTQHPAPIQLVAQGVVAFASGKH